MVSFLSNFTFAIVLFMISLEIIRGEIERPFFKRTDCGNFCHTVRCAPQKPEDCNARTEVFVERDADCYCCDTCAPRDEMAMSLNKKCSPDHCKLALCRDVPAKECFNNGMAYTPKDGDCACCDKCEPI